MSSGLIFLGIGGEQNNQIMELITLGLSVQSGSERGTINIALVPRPQTFFVKPRPQTFFVKPEDQ